MLRCHAFMEIKHPDSWVMVARFCLPENELLLALLGLGSDERLFELHERLGSRMLEPLYLERGLPWDVARGTLVAYAPEETENSAGRMGGARRWLDWRQMGLCVVNSKWLHGSWLWGVELQEVDIRYRRWAADISWRPPVCVEFAGLVAGLSYMERAGLKARLVFWFEEAGDAL